MSTRPPDNRIERIHHPVPLPASTKEAEARLFFGGSFDPPHLAHTQLPVPAAQQLEVILGMMPNACHIVYVPAARSPHKDTDPTPDLHRIEMLNRAIQSIDHPATVWTQELADGLLNENKPSYWADTWAIVHSMLTTGVNRFLIGADQALTMHRWHRYEEFWQDAIVILRGNDDPRNDIANLINQLDHTGAWSVDELRHWQSMCVEIPMLPYSSTSIRTQLAAIDRESVQKNTRIEGLDPGVQSYIFEHGLYC
jgi:nicotinate-nucleotide adenylyltransferase